MTKFSSQSLLPKEAPRKMFTRGVAAPRPSFVLSQGGLYRQRDGKLSADLQGAEVYHGLVGKSLNVAGDIFDIVPVRTITVLIEGEKPVAPSPAAVIEQRPEYSPGERATVVEPPNTLSPVADGPVVIV